MDQKTKTKPHLSPDSVALSSTEGFRDFELIVLVARPPTLLLSFSLLSLTLLPATQSSCFQWKRPPMYTKSQTDTDWLVSIVKLLAAEELELIESKTELEGEWILHFHSARGQKHDCAWRIMSLRNSWMCKKVKDAALGQPDGMFTNQFQWGICTTPTHPVSFNLPGGLGK